VNVVQHSASRRNLVGSYEALIPLLELVLLHREPDIIVVSRSHSIDESSQPKLNSELQLEAKL
jgi:hypothetical protein